MRDEVRRMDVPKKSYKVVKRLSVDLKVDNFHISRWTFLSPKKLIKITRDLSTVLTSFSNDGWTILTNKVRLHWIIHSLHYFLHICCLCTFATRLEYPESDVIRIRNQSKLETKNQVGYQLWKTPKYFEDSRCVWLTTSTTCQRSKEHSSLFKISNEIVHKTSKNCVGKKKSIIHCKKKALQLKW